MRQPHEAMPRVAGGEHQAVHHPAPTAVRINEEAEPAKVDLQLVARLTVSDAHRRSPTPAASAHLMHVALHDAHRDGHSTALEQLGDLHPGQVLDHPASDVVVMGDQQPPRLAVAVAAVRTHRLDHHPNDRIGQLILTAVANNTECLDSGDVTADRLAVHLRQSFDRTDAFAGQPQPEHFSHFEHTNLPERHSRLADPVGRERQPSHPQRGRHWWTPTAGPMPLALTAPGGPMLLAGDTLTRPLCPGWTGDATGSQGRPGTASPGPA